METTSVVPCIGCHTDCCEHYVVPVTAHDIYRIAQALHVEPAAFLELHSTDGEPGGAHIGDGYYRVALRKDDNKACVFLMKIGADRRCSIQSFKPGVCAVYPFTLDNDDKLWHRKDMLCPRPWTLNWLEQQSAKADIRHLRAEMGFYEGLVARWNDDHPDGGPFEEYIDFMFRTAARSQGEAS